MGRPVSRHSVGREVDTLERLHELLVPRSDEDVPAASSGTRVTLSTAILGSSANSPLGDSDLISPPAHEALSDEAFAPETMLPFPTTPVIQSTLPEVEDYRLFHPESIRDVRPLRSVRGNRVRLVASSPPKGKAYALPHAVSAEAKDSVIFCIRRKNRRGVLLALGQGGGFHRPPKRSPTSDIWCE